MAAKSNYQLLINKLDRFIRKFYFNKLIRGVLYTTGLVIGLFLVFSQLENFFRFSTDVRKVFFYSFIGVSALATMFWVMLPTLNILKLGRVISHEKAAEIIGTHFTDIKDKLLNVLQLKSQSQDSASQELIEASINQKIEGINIVPFRSAIDLSKNRKYLKYALPPLMILFVLLFARPSMITDPTERLIKNDQEFEQPAPFAFQVQNEELEVIQYEDFQLNVLVDGIPPNDANIFINDFPFKLTKENQKAFSYTFNKIQKSTEFYLEAGGFKSKTYSLNVIPKPVIIGFTAQIDYPAYTQRKDEVLSNTGDMVLPAGTKVQWGFEAQNTDEVKLRFGSDTLINAKRNGTELFTYGTRIFRDNPYSIFISSEKVKNADSIGYTISVIPDLHPEISVEQYEDSTDNKVLYFLGDASDDYGIKAINFVYNVTGASATGNTVSIASGNVKKNSRYTHTWDLNDLELANGDKLTYFFEVWDNDGVRGSKVSRSNTMTYELPSLEELEDLVDESKEDFEEELKEAIKEAEKIREEVKEIKDKLVQKEDLDWEDKKQIEKMMSRQKDLQSAIENVQNKFEENKEQEEKFKDFSEELQAKKDKLEEFMKEMLTEEMKEMMEKFDEELEEMTPEEMMEELEEMEMTDEQLQKELERMEELFKQMELEQKMEETIEKLEELAEKEEELAEETKENQTGNLEEEKKKQEDIAEEFEEVKKDIEKIDEMAEELEKDPGMAEQEEMAEQADEMMEQSQDQMEAKDKQKASKSQQDASKKMKEMASKMQQQKDEMQQEQAEEDMQAIRQLLENLVALSFNQEKVMDDIKETSVNNPMYVDLVQEQYKLKDDFQIIEDSLVALSKRAVKIESFILKELTEVERNFKSGLHLLEDRKKNESSVNQQYVMTSVNNLALMLSESLQQMQQDMMSSQPGGGSCNKPGGSGAGMSGMKKKQMKLNSQLEKMLEDMQKGKKPGNGKSGGENGKKPGEEPGKDGGMSKEFAETARMQQEIRNALEQFNKENNKDGSGDLGDLEKLMDEMDKTEEQLVNKTITREMIKRQQEIMTKLLEAEEAERKRGFEEKRQGETAQERTKAIPPEIAEYLKKRESEIELYKTVSPELRTYYRNLVEKYFKSISF